ncbi:MAG TPA: class I SAM-dependent methyltransferase [Candidatus Nitrosotalea sp.]|nr:class I SAM-dependent methyltransferase [Candidatus Nitrosotalea sp.]
MTRSLRDSVARLGLAEQAFWLYGKMGRALPRTIFANARLRNRGAPDGLPIPPSDLIFLVAGSSDISWFLKAGSLAAKSISDALRARGVSMEEVGAVLDFGCGCGRVLRHWHSLHQTRICGTDYNSKLVEWCRSNLPFGEFQVNQLSPPLPYRSAEFGLVYALSVFTHLTEDLQFRWMNELSRVITPGGYLIVSTHGERYVHRLSNAERKRFDAGDLVVKNNINAPGSNTCSAYHPMAFVRDRLAAGLQVVDFIPEGARGNPKQDLYVLRKPMRQS